MKVPFYQRITVQLLLVAVVPSLVMFFLVNGLLYAQRLSEVREDLQGKGKLLATALAESSQYAVVSGNASTLEPTLKRLLDGDASIKGIQILSEDRAPLVVVRPGGKVSHITSFEHAIRRPKLEIDLLDGVSSPHFSVSGEVISGNSFDEATVGYVVVDMSSDQIIASKLLTLVKTTVLMLLGALLSCAVGVFFTHRLRRSMSFLVRALQSIRAGNYSIESPTESASGEVAVLQGAICDMAETLKATTQNLESQVVQRTVELDAALSALKAADGEKRRLISRANHQIEEERKRISAEIHDDFNAVLIAVKMRAEQLIYLSQIDSSLSKEVAKHAASILAATEDAYASARSLVKGLRPEILDTLGLAAALNDLVRGYNELVEDCAFEIHLGNDLPEVHDLVAITAFRLVQECLVNAVKHADASLVTVDVSVVNQQLSIVVSDDGKGLNLVEEPSGGLGLAAMRERVEAIGGYMHIDSAGIKGTTVSFNLPMYFS